ncbi:acylphosphatase [Thermoleptolyngbya sp. M55_K2018_002]|uniref:acylphosphatase n=1 Tax=Thermoleptolyngbya sp. M55_K2018_002 TaxID=2747808 RepID=UPI0019FACDB9|nr:acylphosphatase [Thermoleptolyngbya sp. M55_K2018_002]HIK39383.1 acylphosphatase [Thermoleptolyngbya sp. M55_K2018_002]
MTHTQPPRAVRAVGNWVRAHVWISGKVQGVGYRFSTCDTATLLKINGWVRNLADGRVEAVFEGPGDRVQEMIRWCHQGPPTAVVKDVAVQYESPEYLRGFELRR